MPSRERTLDVSTLLATLSTELLDWSNSEEDSFGLTLEALPVERQRRPGAGHAATPARRLLPQLAAHGEESGIPFEPDGRWYTGGSRRIDLGPGGQVRVHSGLEATPGAAYEQATVMYEDLRLRLEDDGMDLVSVGFDPWNDLDSRPMMDATPWGQCEQRILRAGSPRGVGAARLSAGNSLRISFGGVERGPRRWRAAWLLAPVLRATFANSPLSAEGASRVRSVRGEAWRFSEPSRCGVQLEGRDALTVGAVEAYLEFAMDARVLWILHKGKAYPQVRPLSFANWIHQGVEGLYPDIHDWRAHLATLRPAVRPESELVLEGADAQLRPFAGVPLLFSAALLSDDQALAATLELLEGRSEHAGKRCGAAWRSGLSDPALGQDARDLFMIAADAILRAPASWVSPTLTAAFVAFHRRYVHASRTPADDLLETFLERSELSTGDLARLEHRVCAESGTPVSWLPSARSA